MHSTTIIFITTQILNFFNFFIFIITLYRVPQKIRNKKLFVVLLDGAVIFQHQLFDTLTTNQNNSVSPRLMTHTNLSSQRTN